MTDPFKRGSAPGRERAEYERPGTFKQGQKRGWAQARDPERVLGRLQARGT